MSGGRIAVRRVALEIPSHDRDLELLGRIVVAGPAGVARLDLAVVRAAIVVEHVAVVALLDPADLDAVAARGLAGADRAGGGPALGILLAGRRAAIEGHGVAVVAALAGLDLAVATNGFRADRGRARATCSGLDLADGRAAVAAVRVAVVALLALQDLPSPHRGLHGLPAMRHCQPDSTSGIRRAAVTALGVAVVAGLVRGQHAVAAGTEVVAGLSLRGAVPIRLDLANPAAAVGVGGVAVVALLAALDDAVAASAAARSVDAGPSRVRGRHMGRQN